LPKLATLNDRFLLYEILRKTPPDAVEGDVAIYGAARNPEINVARIVHFAMGIFWKASVHPWKKGRTEPRIELGPYSEKLRMFLRGETPFPEETVLTVGVQRADVKFITFIDPYRGSAAGHRNFVFHVPGMQFVLAVGKTIDAGLRQCCILGNPLHPITVLDVSERMMEIYRSQTSKAHRAQKLVEYLEARKRL
jgi:hypothetical protein